ncbi:unnamed protein product [Rangifer tarandus platyrhynchus]|uniref:Uncharacterized protein n=1 Tax=Rangifer tarandus platyrhynchus TaxID=3082113 RepID=A0AC60A6S0_RANTA
MLGLHCWAPAFSSCGERGFCTVVFRLLTVAACPAAPRSLQELRLWHSRTLAPVVGSACLSPRGTLPALTRLPSLYPLGPPCKDTSQSRDSDSGLCLLPASKATGLGGTGITTCLHLPVFSPSEVSGAPPKAACTPPSCRPCPGQHFALSSPQVCSCSRVLSEAPSSGGSPPPPHGFSPRQRPGSLLTPLAGARSWGGGPNSHLRPKSGPGWSSVLVFL